MRGISFKLKKKGFFVYNLSIISNGISSGARTRAKASGKRFSTRKKGKQAVRARPVSHNFMTGGLLVFALLFSTFILFYFIGSIGL